MKRSLVTSYFSSIFALEIPIGEYELALFSLSTAICATFTFSMTFPFGSGPDDVCPRPGNSRGIALLRGAFQGNRFDVRNG